MSLGQIVDDLTVNARGTQGDLRRRVSGRPSICGFITGLERRSLTEKDRNGRVERRGNQVAINLPLRDPSQEVCGWTQWWITAARKGYWYVCQDIRTRHAIWDKKWWHAANKKEVRKRKEGTEDFGKNMLKWLSYSSKYRRTIFTHTKPKDTTTLCKD